MKAPGGRPIRRGVAIAGALALFLLLPGLGLGHAYLVKSNPPSRAVISRAPSRIQLWFNERLEAAFSTLAVVDAAGAGVDRGDVEVDREDTRKLSVGVPALGPGTYSVRYRVLSVDGHIVESQFSFTVRGRR